MTQIGDSSPWHRFGAKGFYGGMCVGVRCLYNVHQCNRNFEAADHGAARAINEGAALPSCFSSGNLRDSS